MNVSSSRVIQKMIAELQLAQQVNSDREKIKQHIMKVHVLCELLLDNEESNEVGLIANQKIEYLEPEINRPNPTKVIIEEDEGSIFDF